MSDLTALACPRCGGPLTRPSALPALLDCVYCGAPIAVGSDHAASVRTPTATHAVREARRVAFQQALVAALGAKVPPHDAVRDAARDHLELGLQAPTAARVAMGLVRDFERDQKVVVAKEPLVLARIVEAYLRALDDLREGETAEINLPFLTADDTGPKHLQRTVTATTFVTIGAEGSSEPPAAPTPSAPPPKKSSWWPFG